MNEAILSLTDLTPIGAVLVLGGLASSVLTQLAKQPHWSKSYTQALALVISIVLGTLAYLVSGLASMVPVTIVEGASTLLMMIAGVAVCSKVVYNLIGYIGSNDENQNGSE